MQPAHAFVFQHQMAEIAMILALRRQQLMGAFQHRQGKTWIGVTSTPKAKTAIAGLPLLVSIAFRVRVNDTLAIGEWTQPTFITLH